MERSCIDSEENSWTSNCNRRWYSGYSDYIQPLLLIWLALVIDALQMNRLHGVIRIIGFSSEIYRYLYSWARCDVIAFASNFAWLLHSYYSLSRMKITVKWSTLLWRVRKVKWSKKDPISMTEFIDITCWVKNLDSSVAYLSILQFQIYPLL